MKCFYHNDLDGECSGAIVKQYFKSFGGIIKDSDFVEMNYNKEFPFQIIEKDEQIIIVDFSLSSIEDWYKLLEITDGITWIDHHQTAIEKYERFDLYGIRDNSKAGCELTWEYFYPKREMPFIVKFLGDYDIWKFEFGDKSRFLQLGIKLNNTSPTNDAWNYWFIDNQLTEKMISEGQQLYNFRQKIYDDAVRGYGFKTEFEGHPAIACNSHEKRSQLFDNFYNIKDYDLMLPFCFDGQKWTVSIYTTKNIDCSEIAKKYGGGGHKKAAGFVCDNLPFKLSSPHTNK